MKVKELTIVRKIDPVPSVQYGAPEYIETTILCHEWRLTDNDTLLLWYVYDTKGMEGGKIMVILETGGTRDWISFKVCPVEGDRQEKPKKPMPAPRPNKYSIVRRGCKQ